MIARFYKKIIDYYTLTDKRQKEACFFDLMRQAYITSFAVNGIKYEVKHTSSYHYPKTFNRDNKTITIIFESDIKSSSSLTDYLISVILDFHSNKQFNNDMKIIIEDLKKIQDSIKR